MLARRPRFQQGFLRQIIRHIAATAQRPRKRAQMGDGGRQFLVELLIRKGRALKLTVFRPAVG
jgi:hypothetical protein